MEHIVAASLNKVILIGYLGKDPEMRSSQDGSKIVTLVVATSEQWRDRMTEEQKERTEWHRVIIFNIRLADIAERFLKKGQRIYVEGQLQSRKWTDSNNEERRVQEIIIRYKGDLMILDMPRRGDAQEERPAVPNMNLSPQQGDSDGDHLHQIEDEIPF